MKVPAASEGISEGKPRPFIKLAQKPATVGADCVAIRHPARGCCGHLYRGGSQSLVAGDGLRTDRAFYDTDNGGAVDLILTMNEDDTKVESELALEDDEWKVRSPKGKSVLDPTKFKDKQRQQRMKHFMRAAGL